MHDQRTSVSASSKNTLSKNFSLLAQHINAKDYWAAATLLVDVKARLVSISADQPCAEKLLRHFQERLVLAVYQN